MRSAVCRVCAFTLAVLTAFPAWAQTPPDAGHARPLVIPQAEGEREGKTLGRALACGAERERVERVLRAGRARMLAAVGRALTEERYVLALDDAMRLETSLPAPSPTSCEKALAALERLEKTP
ncbi:UrcA family protein [Methylorubrum thiocyanatum]